MGKALWYKELTPDEKLQKTFLSSGYAQCQSFIPLFETCDYDSIITVIPSDKG